MHSRKMKRTLISRTKDAALRKALLHFLRPRFERYGQILELEVNTTAKALSADLLLKARHFFFFISKTKIKKKKKRKRLLNSFLRLKGLQRMGAKLFGRSIS